jgi:cell division protein FtsB
LKAFLLCLFIGGSGVGYVWQKNQIYELGKQIKARENRLKELQVQNEKTRRQIAMLHSPQFIELRIKELNLGLVRPEANQIWRMVEPSADISGLPGVPAVRQLATRRNANATMP